jgi:hypothetical protein
VKSARYDGECGTAQSPMPKVQSHSNVEFPGKRGKQSRGLRDISRG